MTRKPQLNVERLEVKDIPSVSFTSVPVGISLSPLGILHIKGDDSRDIAIVSIENGQVHAIHNHLVDNPVEGMPPMPLPFQNKWFALDAVKSISFAGLDGNDSFANETAIKSNALGGKGNDVLIGGSNADLLAGGTDDDTLEGRGGDDDLRGGGGSDWYRFASPGNLGTDKVYDADGQGEDLFDFSDFDGGITLNLGQIGNQSVAGSLILNLRTALGIEDVYGTPGSDNITGNGRANLLNGYGGNDVLSGNGGDDRLYGGSGNDELYGGSGKNTISDGVGNDMVSFVENSIAVTFTTGGGNDTVCGSPFNDHLIGSNGNDNLDGFLGNDTLEGGAGNDWLFGGGDNNTISDGSGNDEIDFSLNAVAVKYKTGGGNDSVIGTKFNDKLTGSSGNDTLSGGKGNDSLFGLGGTDVLNGGDGNDWLEAGSASEEANGGSGTDYNAHKWAIDGTTCDDVLQAGIGSCVFLSGLSSAAAQGFNLSSRISYLGDYTYNVALYNLDTGEIDNRHIYFNGFIYKKPDGTRIDPWQANKEEYWTILFQRAYVQMVNNADLDFTDPDDAMFAVTGRSVDTGDWGDAAVVRDALIDGKVVTAGNADDTLRVYAHHSYSVLDVYQLNGTWRIKLRNPWGKDVNANDIANGTKLATGANDGIIDMTWSSFQGYNDFDRISIS